MFTKRFGATGLVLLLLAGSSAVARPDAPLADAAEKKDRAKVAALLKKGTDVNASQADGMTALHWAAYHDDLPTATLLVKAGADAKAANRYAVTPLSLACTNGNAEIVGLLLEAGADPNTTLRGGETALMTAARTGKAGPIKALLARGAKVNAKDRKGQTALMWAAAEGHAEVVSTLLSARAEFKSPLPSGFTPLLFAAREGRLDVVRVLLKAGADVNDAIQSKRTVSRGPKPGTSALLMAVENGHFELAIALVKAGADPNDQRAGYGALHMLSWVRKPSRGDDDEGAPPPIGSGKLTSLEFVKEMVANGAKVNLRSKTGVPGRGILSRAGATPLLAAASTADLPLLEVLVKLGADPSIANSQRSTPLMASAGVGVGAPEESPGAEPEVIEAVQLLIKLGADVNAVDDHGETAMHGAAYRNHPKLVQLLADKGARIDVWNKANKTGLTPIVVAEGHRPGLNFRPSPETVAALHRVMRAAGVKPPKPSSPPAASGSAYDDKKKAAVASDRPASPEALWEKLSPFSRPPKEFAGKLGSYRSPLQFADGSTARTAADWTRRREEILKTWHKRLGPWPPLVERPVVKKLEKAERDGYTEYKVQVQASPDSKWVDGYLLIPRRPGPFPGVVVPFYEPLTSIGRGAKGSGVGTHDYGLQLVKRGFVTLSIGTPGSLDKLGGDTRDTLIKAGADLRRQPLTLLAYVAANCHSALARMPEVDPHRNGIIGLSYGGKWSMFASCLDERFACAVWSDPGIVFNEKDSNVNYWEPWYLGYDPKVQRKPGVPSPMNPRTGLYKEMIDAGEDLVDLHALMAPRPVLVSGGVQDPPGNWQALNHLVAVNNALGHKNRAFLTARKTHVPTAEALELELAFLEYFLKHAPPKDPKSPPKGLGAKRPQSYKGLGAFRPQRCRGGSDR